MDDKEIVLHLRLKSGEPPKKVRERNPSKSSPSSVKTRKQAARHFRSSPDDLTSFPLGRESGTAREYLITKKRVKVTHDKNDAAGKTTRAPSDENVLGRLAAMDERFAAMHERFAAMQVQIDDLKVRQDRSLRKRTPILLYGVAQHRAGQMSKHPAVRAIFIAKKDIKKEDKQSSGASSESSANLQWVLVIPSASLAELSTLSPQCKTVLSSAVESESVVYRQRMLDRPQILQRSVSKQTVNRLFDYVPMNDPISGAHPEHDMPALIADLFAIEEVDFDSGETDGVVALALRVILAISTREEVVQWLSEIACSSSLPQVTSAQMKRYRGYL